MLSCKFLSKGIGIDGWASLCHSCNVFLKKGGSLGAHVNSLETMVLHLGFVAVFGSRVVPVIPNCILMLDMLGASVILKEKMLTILTFFTCSVHEYFRGSIPHPCLTVRNGLDEV